MKERIPPKMVEWTIWALWWLMIGGAGTWLLVGSVGYWVRIGWLPVGTSDWVQAIGSIGAISVAAWAALHSASTSRLAAARAASERKQVINRALYELATRGLAAVQLLSEKLDKPGDSFRATAQFAAARLNAARVTADDFKLTDMPEGKMIDRLLELQLVLDEGARIAQYVVDVGSFPRERAALITLDEQFDRLADHFAYEISRCVA